MTTPCLLAIDQGTTSTRAIAFGLDGSIIAMEQRELPLITPQSGWVEQDANIIAADVVAVTKAVIGKVGAANVKSIGITNQRETVVAWDKATGRPLYNAIVWQDRRGADLCARLKQAGHETDIQQKTGLLLDPYFSATKIAWLMDNVDAVAKAAKNDTLMLGTIDAFVLWLLTSGKSFATDATNASRTLVYDVRKNAWDAGLCKLFNVPQNALPDVHDSDADFGVTYASVLGAALPVKAILGDQQAALFGQACFEPGMIKSTYGTGCFALMNIGPDFAVSKNRLLTTIAWRIGGETVYAAEGAIFVAGAAIQFLRDNLGLIKDAPESEKLAQEVDTTDGVVFVPALSGLGAPHWDAYARGGLFGLSRGTKPAHIVRAALEAQAYQSRDLIDAFTADSGLAPSTLRVDGGLVRNDLVCRMIATATGISVERPANTESTAWGAAALAGIKAGIIGFDDVAKAAAKGARLFEKDETIKLNYDGWRAAVNGVKAAIA